MVWEHAAKDYQDNSLRRGNLLHPVFIFHQSLDFRFSRNSEIFWKYLIIFYSYSDDEKTMICTEHKIPQTLMLYGIQPLILEKSQFPLKTYFCMYTCVNFWRYLPSVSGFLPRSLDPENCMSVKYFCESPYRWTGNASPICPFQDYKVVTIFTIHWYYWWNPDS